VEALDDDAAVFSTLQAYPVYRSFPLQDYLTCSAVGVLREVLQYGSVRFDHNDEGMKLCFENGWVQVDAMDQTGANER
jgi:hypothetical protein